MPLAAAAAAAHWAAEHTSPSRWKALPEHINAEHCLHTQQKHRGTLALLVPQSVKSKEWFY